MLTASAWREDFSIYARDLMGLRVFWIVRHLVDSGMRDLIPWFKRVADARHSILLMRNMETIKPSTVEYRDIFLRPYRRIQDAVAHRRDPSLHKLAGTVLHHSGIPGVHSPHPPRAHGTHHAASCRSARRNKMDAHAAHLAAVGMILIMNGRFRKLGLRRGYGPLT